MHLFSMSWLCSCFAIQILAGHRPNGSWIGLVCLLLVFSCYKSVKLNKLLLLQDIPPSAMANIRTVSSLAEVNGVLEEMGIDTIGGANQVQFRLHEQASLKDATKMKTRIRPGRHGFKLVNSELFDCKFKAMVELQEGYNTMVETCMVDCDHQLLPLEARIAELKYLLLSTDEEIPKIGFGAAERNRGVQQMRYPNRPVCLFLFSSLLFCFSHFSEYIFFLVHGCATSSISSSMPYKCRERYCSFSRQTCSDGILEV